MQTPDSKRISRGLVRGTFVVALNRLVDAIIGLAIVPYTLHRLGVEAYGLWALMYAITGYINLADLGFSSSLNRHFSQSFSAGNREEQKQVLSTAFFFMAGFSLLVIALTLAIEPWLLGFFPTLAAFGDTANWVYRSLMLVLGISYLTNYSRSLLVSSHRTDRMATIQIFLALLNAGMIVFVLGKGWGLLGLAFGSLAVALVRFTVFFVAANLTIGNWLLSPRSFSRQVLSALWKFGMTLQVARIADVVNNQFDRVLLGKVSQLNMVTSYDLGAKGATSANLLTQVILYAVEPAAAAFHSTGSTQQFHKLVERSAKYVALLSIPLAFYLNVAARPLLTFWLGSPPADSVVLALRFLIFAYIGNSLSLPVRLAARGAGKPGWEAKYSLMQAVVNILLSTLLYFSYGLKGVLYGTLFASLLANSSLIHSIIVGLELPFKRLFFEGYLRPFLVAVVSGLVAWGAMSLVGVMPREADRLIALPYCVVSALGFGFGLLGSALLFRSVSWGEVIDLLKRSRSSD